MPSDAELAIRVTGKDVSATRVLRGVSREADRFSTKLAGIGSKAGRNFARNLERTVIAGAAAAAGGIGYSLKVAGDFEAQLNTINTIARQTPDGLRGIGDGIRQIFRDTGTPLEELTAGYYDLLSAGVQVADAQGILVSANKLAIGGLASTAETVDLLTTALNVYGGGSREAAVYADYFAKAVERGKVKASDIAGTFAAVGNIAKTSGIEIDEIAAAYARLTAGGAAPGEVATQMRSAIIALTKVGSPLEKLQKQTGRNYLALAGKKGLVFALEQLRKDADKAGVPLIKLLGRVEALNFAVATTGDNFGAYNADLASMNDAAGTAAEQAAQRQQGLNYQVDRLRANIQDAAITIGTELLPVFADLAEEGADWLRSHQPEIRRFAQDLATSIRDAVEYARGFDWDGIARALEGGASAAKALLDTFMALPPEAKAALVGGYAVNKVTGGAVTDLAGLGLQAAFDRFVGRGSSPANPLFVMPVGGAIGGAGAGGIVAGGGRFGMLRGLGALAALGIGSDLLLGSNAAGMLHGDQGAGFVGNVGGGALAGLGFGPVGVLVGGLAGVVKSVQEVESAITAQEAERAHANLLQNGGLAGVSTSELNVKLAAIDTGLAQIRGLPFGELLHGDAVRELEQMRAEVVAQLEANGQQQDYILQANRELTGRVEAFGEKIRAPRGRPPDARDSERNTDAVDKVRSATERAYTAAERTKASVDFSRAAAHSDAAMIAAAIRANRAMVDIDIFNRGAVRTTATAQVGGNITRSGSASGSGPGGAIL